MLSATAQGDHNPTSAFTAYLDVLYVASPTDLEIGGITGFTDGTTKVERDRIIKDIKDTFETLVTTYKADPSLIHDPCSWIQKSFRDSVSLKSCLEVGRPERFDTGDMMRTELRNRQDTAKAEDSEDRRRWVKSFVKEFFAVVAGSGGAVGLSI